MESKDKYIKYVPSAFRNKKVYMDILNIFLQNYIDLFNFIQEIPIKYIINTQNSYILNTLGDIFNVTRYVDPPIYVPSFSWNISGLGWNQSEWGSQENIQTLVDDILYSWLINLKAKLSLWDGTNIQLKNILETAFPGNEFIIIDNMNNTIVIYVKFDENIGYSLKQLIINGALPINLTGTKIIWEYYNA